MACDMLIKGCRIIKSHYRTARYAMVWNVIDLLDS